MFKVLLLNVSVIVFCIGFKSLAAPGQLEKSKSFFGKKEIDPLKHAYLYCAMDSRKEIILKSGKKLGLEANSIKAPEINYKNTFLRASEKGDARTIDLLINMDKRSGGNLIDFNAGDADGNNALHYAACNGSVFMINKLLLYGVDMFAENVFGQIPYDIAFEFGHVGVMYCFIKQANISLIDMVRKNRHKTINYILTMPKINLNMVNRKGQTPLMLAAENKNHNLVRFLLGHGAIARKRDFVGNTALIYAIDSKCKETVKAVLDGDAVLLVMKNRSGLRPYDYALQCKCLEIIDIIKRAQDERFLDLLGSGNEELIRMFIAMPEIAVNKRSTRGDTPLILATRYGQISLILELLSRGADINARNNRRETALVKALASGNLFVAELLRSNGAIE